jgi:hypothetical protein
VLRIGHPVGVSATDDPNAPMRERLLAGIDDDYADYDFRSAEEVFGGDGANLVAWWAQALAERALIHPDHYADAAKEVVVKFATTPERTMTYSFYGQQSWRDWDGSLEDARDQLALAVPDYAGQVKADRGYGGGHHPWDDPKDA